MKGLNKILLVATLSMAGTLAFADDELEFKAKLSGAEEVPNPVITNTSGEAEFEVNEDWTRIDFKLEIEDAVAILAVAGAHIHCAPKGSNGPVVAFLAGALPGGLNGDVEIEATLTGPNIVNPDTECGETIADLVESMLAGLTYVNVHSAANPGGEIRGQIRAEDD